MKTKTENKKTFYNAFFKRFADIMISLVAIIILLPILLILYLLNGFFMGFPAILKQPRPGKNNKIFYIYKFRSMTNKKDKNGNLLPDSQRITLWGKIMRKTSLDELPQLFNILFGQMSIIGFRPRLIKDVIFYDKEVFDSYTKAPGLTGPIQAYKRNDCSWEEIFEIDKKYNSNLSFATDTKIFFKTFSAVLTKGGESHDHREEDKKFVRDYYYADYLLKSEKISKDQYDYGMAIAQEITLGKRPLSFHPEILDTDLFEKMNKHKHSIIIIKNKKGEVLQYFDEKWNQLLFPNLKNENYKPICEIKDYLKSQFNLEESDFKLRYLYNCVHEKLSVPTGENKTYNHYFYEVKINKLPDIMKSNSFEINNKKFIFKSLNDLENDEHIMKNNSDIINIVKNLKKL